jgi:hypothetical protein
MQDNDMIAVVFDHDDFDFSITIPFMKKKYFTVEMEPERAFQIALALFFVWFMYFTYMHWPSTVLGK